MNRQSYSDFLHDTAAKWGATIPGRPLITGPDPDEYKLPLIKRYVLLDAEEKKTQEKRRKRHKYHVMPGAEWVRNQLDIVGRNGLFSYAYHITAESWGCGYSGCMKFCEPYKTEEEALRAGVAAILRAVEDHHYEKVLEGSGKQPGRHVAVWAKSLLEPVQEQLELFAA